MDEIDLSKHGLGDLTLDEYGLADAIRDQMNELVEELLEKGIGIDRKTSIGMTPLRWAAWYGDTKLVERLLALKADPNIRDASGDTPLHLAASFGHWTTVDALLKGGASANALNDDGRSPFFACMYHCGYHELASVLLEAGSDINTAETKTGNTPLHRAVLKKNSYDIKYLLEKGADPDLKNKMGLTAGEVALGIGYKKGMELLSK